MTYCDHSNQDEYPFKLPELPYEKDAFEPHFSPETFDYHHGMHHNSRNLMILLPVIYLESLYPVGPHNQLVHNKWGCLKKIYPKL